MPTSPPPSASGDGQERDPEPDHHEREQHREAREIASCGLLPGRDHHAARRVLEDVVDGLAEDVAVAAARRAENDDLGLPARRPPRRSPGRRCGRGRRGRSCGRRRRRRPPARRRARRSAFASSSRRSASSGQVERHDDHAERDDRRAALGREAGREVDRLVGLRAGDDRDEDRPVLERDRRPELERREHRLAERHPEAAPVEDVERRTRPRARRGRRSGSARPGRRRRARRARCRARRGARRAASSTPRTRRFGLTRYGLFDRWRLAGAAGSLRRGRS